MHIEVTVPEITLSTIIGEVFGFDEDGDPIEGEQVTVADKVAKILAEAVMKSPEFARLKDRVTEIRKDVIREELQPIVRQALQAPIRKTNGWGEPTGQETTLTEIIMDEAKKAWSLGKDSYDRRQAGIREVIAAEVRGQIGDAVKKAVKEAQDAALKAVGDVAAAPVVEAVRKALGK